MPALQHMRHFAAVVFVAATVVLTIQLINPSPVMVTVGDNNAEVAELGGYFQYRDVAVITAAACLLGASGTYLLTATEDQRSADTAIDWSRVSATDSDPGPSEELLERRRQEWAENADRLASNEREIYEAVLEADGVLEQSAIVKRLDLSKATVSRGLDSLETKNLVEKQRRGMGNVVHLR